MNGIHAVSNSAKRILCHPICPCGTPGRILSKRLRVAHSYSTDSPIDFSSAAIEALMSRPTTSQQAFGNVRIPFFDFDVKTTEIKALNTHVTGLTLLETSSATPPAIPLLLAAIEKRHDTCAWRYFSQLQENGQTHFLGQANFLVLLLSLRPDRFVSFEQRHRISPNGTSFYLLPEKLLFDAFHNKIRTVIRSMYDAGYRLDLRGFSHLLECARAIRNKDLADYIWRLLEARKDLFADTWCYNCYMAAICGTEETERFMVIDKQAVARRIKRGMKWGDMRTNAFRIYKTMVGRAVAPNITTINLLMLAMARLGDIDGVRGVLKNLWQIDTNALSSETNQSVKSVKDSPLYPDSHTITTVALAFGMNLEVEMAIRLVDHMARKFELTIEMTAWIALLNWSYALSRPERKLLPTDSVQKLWQIMTEPPYNVTPTLEMWDYLIRSLIQRQMYTHAEKSIDSAIPIYNDLLSAVPNSEEAYLAAATNASTPIDEFNDLERQYATVMHSLWRGRSIIRRWVELMILSKGMMTHHISYPRSKVPNFVAKYGDFLGKSVVYHLDSGYVELDLGQDKEWVPKVFRRRKRPWMPLGTNWKEEDDF